jgi:two-component system, NtrC family, response regulator AtoC
LAIDVPASIGRSEGNFRHEVALNRPERALTGWFDPPFFDRLRNSSTVRVVPTAQVAQLALAVHLPSRPYWAAERGAGQNVHTTVPGSHHELADTNSVGLFLLVVGSDSYSTYNLPQDGSVTIGRGETNQIRIDDPLASRNHARLHVGSAMFLEDLGSVNGTRVKDHPVKRGDRIPIAIGETILIGGSVLIIQHRARKRPPLLRPETLRDDRAISAVLAPPQDQAMQRIHQLAERAAAGTINVLVTGETGVGKELLAETVHRLSPRKDGPYVCLNCAALSETLLESELFGHERGAFTGAFQAKAGLLETAGGGSIFLDEVGELTLTTQAKLLRVLETREVSRLGSLKPRRIDVRFIAATNRDLEAEVARGAFRRDLYFRLNGITLTIPPLRERRSEIPHLAGIFLRRICRELGRPEPQLPPPILEILDQYLWPGNIRELKNMIERAVLLCDGPAIGLDHLPADKIDPARAPKLTPPPPPSLAAAAAAERTRSPTQENERERIIDALNACAGNQSRAAQRLGISRRTLVTKLDTYRIPRPKKALGEA